MPQTLQRPTRKRSVLAACAVLALIGLVAPGAAAAAPSPNFPVRIDLPDGFAPEGITTGHGATVFAGSLADGAIWRGDVRTGEGAVLVPGITGRVAVGVDYERSADRLWVVGGPTGAVTAYDASTGAELMRYTVAGAGFLNDLVVTRTAVYVTDSFVQQLVVIPLGADGSLPDQSGVIIRPLTGDISYVANDFNANGIDATHDGRILFIVQSATSTLFRVVAATGETRAITLTGGTLSVGDGLELRGHTLYVVRGAPNAVVTVRLGKHLAQGQVFREITDPSLDVPTTATFAAGRLYAVNARFGTPVTATTDYWITRLPGRYGSGG